MANSRKPSLGLSRVAFQKKYGGPGGVEKMRRRAEKRRARSDAPKPEDALSHRSSGCFEMGKNR